MPTSSAWREISFKNKIPLFVGGIAHIVHAAPDIRISYIPSTSTHLSEAGSFTSRVNVQYCGKAEDDTIHTAGDPEIGPGFWITNNDGVKGDYFVYENSRDDHPWKYITLENSVRAFVQVCPTWQGHVIRGTPAANLGGQVQNLGTWAMASVDINGAMWGGLSFLQGSDGGGSVNSTDGSAQRHGCTVDILAGAPEAALSSKGSGARVLSRVVGEGPNVAAMDWMLTRCSSNDIYILENGPNPVVKSTNGRLEWMFLNGKF